MLAWALATGPAPFAGAAEPSGAADGPETKGFRELVRRGLTAYEEKQFLLAADLFLRAHALEPEPELVFNAARSYEKGLAREEAVELYETVIGMPGTTAELRARALESLEQLRKEQAALRLRRKQSSAAVQSPTPTPTPDPPPPVATVPASVPEKVTRRNRTPEWILLSTGASAAVAAGILGGLALDARSSLDSATGPERLDFRNQAQGRAAASDALMVTALVSGATAALLWWIRSPKKSGESR